MAISAEAFTRYTADGDCVAVLGEYEVVVGGSLPVGPSRELGAASPSKATVTIG